MIILAWYIEIHFVFESSIPRIDRPVFRLVVGQSRLNTGQTNYKDVYLHKVPHTRRQEHGKFA